MIPTLMLSVVYLALAAGPAHAYIDPVTGSFVLQAVIGAFATVLVAIRRVREKFLGLLGIRKPDAEAVDQVEDHTKS